MFLIDEIVESKLTLERLWEKIKAKPYAIRNWFCDSAGKQTREQTGISNVSWFQQSPRNIHFKYRNTAISYGIPLVRSFIQNGMGQKKLFIDPRCRKTIDQMKSYRYPEKDGIIGEVPVKEHDHCCDALRYYFVNRHDFTRAGPQAQSFNRWSFR